jgi:hypothetical protein
MKKTTLSNSGMPQIQEENERLRYILASLGEIGHGFLSEGEFLKASKTALRGVLGAIGISKGALLAYDKISRILSPVVFLGTRKPVPSLIYSKKPMVHWSSGKTITFPDR